VAASKQRTRCLRERHAKLAIYVPFRAASESYVSEPIAVQHKSCRKR
jgi:hypothetical protein